MKIWEMLTEQERQRWFMFGEATEKDILVCVSCGQRWHEDDWSDGNMVEKFPHKSECFLIQEYDTVKGKNNEEYSLLMVLAWRQLVKAFWDSGAVRRLLQFIEWLAEKLGVKRTTDDTDG